MLTSAPTLQAGVQLLANHRARLLPALDACAAQAFYFSAANLVPKLALGKLSLEARDDALIVTAGDGGLRVLPLGDRGDYYRLLLGLASSRHTLSQVPGWAIPAWRSRFKVTKGTEYLIHCDTQASLPGPRLHQLRKDVRKARAACVIETFSEAAMPDYLAVNKSWYRQNAALKFRTYDKTSIDWLLGNMAWVVALFPDVTCYGVRHEGKLVSFSVGSRLSAGVWSAYTRRFDRECPIRKAGFLGYQALAATFGPTSPLENNGTADTKSLAEIKDKLCCAKYVSCKVGP